MDRLTKRYLEKLDDNVIYTNQFAIIAFIVMIVFKIAMLPSYMYGTVDRDSWVVICVLMLIESVMFFVTLYVTKRINLLADTNKWFSVVHVLMYAYAMLRLTALYSGLIAYTSNSLFDQGRIDFIVYAFALVIPYIASKGGNTIARLFEIIFYFLAASLLFMALVPSFKADFTELMPVLGGDNGKLVGGFFDFSMWFGDYMPLLYFSVKPHKKKFLDKCSLPGAVTIATVGVTLFYVLFIAVYGEAGSEVYFAFNRMSVYNLLSDLLGATNFLSILVWMIMSVLHITMLFLTICNSLMWLIKSKTVAIVLNTVVVALVQLLLVKNLENAHNFATSEAKYFVLVLQFAIPIALAIYARYVTKKQTENKITPQKSALISQDSAITDKEEVQATSKLPSVESVQHGRREDTRQTTSQNARYGVEQTFLQGKEIE